MLAYILRLLPRYGHSSSNRCFLGWMAIGSQMRWGAWLSSRIIGNSQRHHPVLSFQRSHTSIRRSQRHSNASSLANLTHSMMDSVTRSGSAKLLPVLHTNNNNNNKKALGTRLTDENMPTNPNRPLNSVRSEISQTQCATVHEQNRTENTDINKAIDIEVDQSNTPEDIMPILDAQHIRTHLPYPTREQYPNAPKSLFANDLRNLGQSFDNSVFRAQRNEVQFTCRTGAPGEPAIWCCTLTLDVPGLGLRSALGEGLRKVCLLWLFLYGSHLRCA